MSPILPKHLMTEEDIKLNYITPALILKGWQDRITMETAVKFTDGKVNLKGNITPMWYAWQPITWACPRKTYN